MKKAIYAGYLKSWLSLALQSINKLTESDATILEYIDYVRKNIQSTSTINEEDEWQSTLNFYVPNKTHTFLNNILDLKDIIYTDQTGSFSCQSLRNNN